MDLSRSGLVIVKNATLNLFSLDTDSGMGAHVIITIPTAPVQCHDDRAHIEVDRHERGTLFKKPLNRGY